MTGAHLDAPAALDALKCAVAIVDTMRASAPEALPVLRTRLAEELNRAAAATGLVRPLDNTEYYAAVADEASRG